MFKQRLLTALCLIPLVLAMLLWAPAGVLFAVMLFFLVAAGREWLNLIPLVNRWHQAGFLCLLLVAVWGCMHAAFFMMWLMVGLLMWIVAALAICTYPSYQSYWGKSYWVGLSGLIFLPIVAGSMMAIYSNTYGRSLIIYLLFLIWATDSGAYLVGKRWGSHRLIPHVSPKKTIEGVIGGVLLALLVAGVSLIWFKPESMVAWFLLAISVVVVSIGGDLFMSMLKRRCHVKDTGVFFPGHGGVLDRLDSLVSAAPIFYVGLWVGFNDWIGCIGVA